MNTRKLVALGIALAFAGLAGAGFAADQKAAPAQARVPGGRPGLPGRPPGRAVAVRPHGSASL